MPTIGYVTKDENGIFTGQLKMLSIRAEIASVPERTQGPRGLAGPPGASRAMSRSAPAGTAARRTQENYVPLSLVAPCISLIGMIAGRIDAQLANRSYHADAIRDKPAKGKVGPAGAVAAIPPARLGQIPMTQLGRTRVQQIEIGEVSPPGATDLRVLRPASLSSPKCRFGCPCPQA